MECKVRLFLGDELIDPSDYDKIRINCPDVDRIVNEIYERNERRPLTRAELDALDDELDGGLGEPPTAGKPSVLKKLFNNFQSKWTKEFTARAKAIGMTRDQVITLASIIQSAQPRSTFYYTLIRTRVNNQ